MSTSYESVIKSVTNAVSTDINSVNKWQLAGITVAEFYGSETALEEVKAQFIADAILPAIGKHHVNALNKELPRKGSKEYKELDSAGISAWETANQAKKDARAVAHTMFNRVKGYAFPAIKDDTESTTKDLKTKINETIANLVKACQKAEEATFDITSVIGALENVLTVVNK